MAVVSLDHVVLVAADVAATLEWYRRVLGAEIRDEAAWRRGEAEYPVVHFGSHKINVHPRDAAPTLRAARPEQGSLDLCFGWDGDVTSAQRRLQEHGAEVVFGPCAQEGARGVGESVYTRDPDGNLIELISYPAEAVLS